MSIPQKSTPLTSLKKIWTIGQMELRMLGLVMVLIAILSFISPHFFTTHNILNLMDQTVVLGIIAVGATLVILTGGIDLSVGSVMGMAGIVFGLSFPSIGFYPAVALCMLAGAVAGCFSGLLVTRVGLAPFVATLGMMSIARSQAYVLSGAKSITALPPEIEFLGNATVADLPLNFICLIVLYLFMWFFLSRTKLGRSIYAIGSNEEAARLAGVAVGPIKTMCYALSGFFAALASIFLFSRIMSIDPLAGNGMELMSIAAVVIGGASLFGGRGSIIGTLMGVFIMVLIRNGLNLMKVDPYWHGTAIGSVIIAALLLERFFRRGSAAK
jgi:ribose transport system permease protein